MRLSFGSSSSSSSSSSSFIHLVVALLILWSTGSSGVVAGEPSRNQNENADTTPPSLEAAVLNSLLADLWPLIGNDMLQKLYAAQPIWLDPFLLQLQPGSRFQNAPRIHQLTLLAAGVEEDNDTDTDTTTTTGTHFQARISYLGKPELHFVLTGADVAQYNQTNKTTKDEMKQKQQMTKGSSDGSNSGGSNSGGTSSSNVAPTNTAKKKKKKKRWLGQLFFQRLLRRIVPDISVEFNSIDLQAIVDIRILHPPKVSKSSQHQQDALGNPLAMTPTQSNGQPQESILQFYFVEKPRIEWDLEFSVMEIPLWGEDSLDQILTTLLERIDEDNPIQIKF